MMVLFGFGGFLVIACTYAWLRYLPNQLQQFDAILASQPNIIGVPIVSREKKPKRQTVLGAAGDVFGKSLSAL